MAASGPDAVVAVGAAGFSTAPGGVAAAGVAAAAGAAPVLSPPVVGGGAVLAAGGGDSAGTLAVVSVVGCELPAGETVEAGDGASCAARDASELAAAGPLSGVDCVLGRSCEESIGCDVAPAVSLPELAGFTTVCSALSPLEGAAPAL